MTKYLTVCALVKDELDLREWVAYHTLIGVEHFVLFDNVSRIPVNDTLARWVEKEIVTVVYFPGHAQQVPAYEHYLRVYNDRSSWTAFLDADEFLLPIDRNDIRTTLQGFDGQRNVGGIGVNWRMFGSSGHETRPAGLLIDQYTKATALYSSRRNSDRHIKSIVKRECADPRSDAIHRIRLLGGASMVTPDGASIIPAGQPFFDPPCRNVLHVNHYFTRSREDFKLKCARGCGNGVGKTMDQFDLYNQFCNDVVDTGITRFSSDIKNLIT